MSSSMTGTEAQQFLSELHVGVVAIARDGRAPLAVPIWYDYEPGGNLKLLMGPDSLKARLLSSAGRFSLCAQSEALPYKYVMVEGPVVETRPADTEQDSRPMAHRYLGQEMGDQYTDNGSDTTSIVVLMEPEVWYSVDYGKAG